MSNRRKIVLVGAGSHYFHGVIGELLSTPEIEGSEIVLFDVNRHRMEMTHSLGKRLIAKVGKGWTIAKTMQLEKAIDGADFAISSVGVHRPFKEQSSIASWHKLDSDAAAKHGILHTTGDTVGPAGLSQGLRIVPIFINLARKMEQYCPDAILLNHSNPMSAICRAVTKYTSIHTIGYCHNVYGDIRRISKILGIPKEELEFTSAGLNHMGWFIDIRHNGKDVYPLLKEKFLKIRAKKGQKFTQELVRLLDIYPVGGDRHMIEFFPHSRLCRNKKKMPYGLQWRSDMITSNSLAAELSTKKKEMQALGKEEVSLPAPEDISPETMGQQIRSLSCGPGRIHFVNVPNNGAISNFPDWAVVEVKCFVGPGGAKPIFAGELPAQAARWSLAQLYTWELMIEAAAEQSRSKALQAMACDPMIQNFTEAVKVFDSLVKVQGDRLKNFRK